LILSKISNFKDHLKNPTFIIGCGRSGTTLLTKCLSLHREICSFSEANDIWDPRVYPWYNTHYSRTPLWIDPYQYIKEWRESFTKKDENNLKNIFGAYQFISRKEVFINKSPMNTFRIKDIIRIFPDCKFINMIRDGRAVTFSWTKRQFKTIQDNIDVFKKEGYDYDFDDLLKYTANSWKEHIKEVNIKNKQLKLRERNRLIEIRYEELTKNPQTTLSEIYDFISVSEHNTNLKDYSLFENRNYKWKEGLSEEQKDIVNMHIEDILVELGY